MDNALVSDLENNIFTLYGIDVNYYDKLSDYQLFPHTFRNCLTHKYKYYFPHYRFQARNTGPSSGCDCQATEFSAEAYTVP